jgi:hypothetical protein
MSVMGHCRAQRPFSLILLMTFVNVKAKKIMMSQRSIRGMVACLQGHVTLAVRDEKCVLHTTLNV